MRSSDEARSEPTEVRETMSMGEAEKLLGVSKPTLRRLCDAYEKNHGEGLAFAWTSPNSGRRDVNGHTLRGHRRPFADAVRAMAEASGRVQDPTG